MSGVTDRLYSIAQKINSKQLDTELGFSPIFLMIVPFAVMYTIANLSGRSIIDKCAEGKLDGKEDIKRYLEYTLIIALTMPVTLLFSKLVTKDVPGYVALLSAMTLVGTSLIANAVDKCGTADDTQKTYNGIYMAISVLALLFSVFIMTFA
jgi:hypothetical protein